MIYIILTFIVQAIIATCKCVLYSAIKHHILVLAFLEHFLDSVIFQQIISTKILNISIETINKVYVMKGARKRSSKTLINWNTWIAFKIPESN